VIARTDGSRVNVRATARPWFDASGEVGLVVISFEDITAEVQARVARATSEERLRQGQRLESLGQLASGVAHDFNNILASINMIAADIRMRDPESPHVEQLRQIETAVGSAAQLTAALLAFGRAGAGRVTRFDFASTVRSVLDLTRRTFNRSIDVAVDMSGSGLLRGDPTQIEQLTLNLLINARDAMPSGGRLSVRVEVADLEAPPIPLAPGKHVILTISDTGPGIPRDIRQRVFEPYFTTKQDLERPGTGLGLATVYGVTQAYGGHVEIDDAEPQGAVFRVTLPVWRNSTSQPAYRPPRPLNKQVTVLVVDDEQLVRDATRRSLERLGYSVIEAKDGQEAVERYLADRGSVDVVLLDAVMPRLNGHEALARLREVAPDLPIILTSGHLGPSDEEAALGAGASSLLVKPYTVAQLSDAVTLVTSTRP